MFAPCRCSLVFDNALVFDDVELESAFRCHWEATSRSLVVLLSMVTGELGGRTSVMSCCACEWWLNIPPVCAGIIWTVALYNTRSHCKWSYMLCCMVQLVCLCSITVQAYFQVWGCCDCLCLPSLADQDPLNIHVLLCCAVLSKQM